MRLIDADALKAEWQNGFYKKIVGALMDDAPTVDAVQVVRCKDCAKRGTINCDLDYLGYRHADNWYCADGERREE